MAKPYLDQDYEKIRNECLRNRKLFDDIHFPPNAYSLARFQHPQTSIVWKRPHQIVNNPQLFVDDADPKDLNQGLHKRVG